MITLADGIELRNLRQEFESYQLLANQFPGKLEYQKKADVLEMRIIDIEQDSKYV